MKLTYPKTWEFIRKCIRDKTTNLLQNFSYAFEPCYREQTKIIKLNWALERSYTENRSDIVDWTKKPIEICLTTAPTNGPWAGDNLPRPYFLWESNWAAKELVMTPILHYHI